MTLPLPPSRFRPSSATFAMREDSEVLARHIIERRKHERRQAIAAEEVRVEKAA